MESAVEEASSCFFTQPRRFGMAFRETEAALALNVLRGNDG
jgi:hypothetical protein